MTWNIGYVVDWDDVVRADAEGTVLDGHAAWDGVTVCGQTALTLAVLLVRVSCPTCRRAFDDHREPLETLIDPSGVIHRVGTVLTLRTPLGLDPPRASRDHRTWCLEEGERLAPADWIGAPEGATASCLACLAFQRRS